MQICYGDRLTVTKDGVIREYVLTDELLEDGGVTILSFRQVPITDERVNS